MNTEDLTQAIESLSPSRRARLVEFLEALRRDVPSTRLKTSDFATDEFVREFGERIQAHHLGSTRALSKENFEYVLVASFRACGVGAAKTKSGTLAGPDVEVSGVPWSLKSEAAQNIKADRIHISKFMELGKGAWETEKDLVRLRSLMFAHLERYERIFTLRCVGRTPGSDGLSVRFSYELVEIPKELFDRSQEQPILFAKNSKQHPVPASCFVPIDATRASDGRANLQNLLMELYFDGGTERKLQIRKILKAECVVHATWEVTATA